MKTLADLIGETDPAKIAGLFPEEVDSGGVFVCERCKREADAIEMQLVLGKVHCIDMPACMRRRCPRMPKYETPLLAGSDTGVSAVLW